MCRYQSSERKACLTTITRQLFEHGQLDLTWLCADQQRAMMAIEACRDYYTRDRDEEQQFAALINEIKVCHLAVMSTAMNLADSS